MRFSSRFISSLAVAILSIALLLCGLSGTAMSQTATPSGGATTSLPSILIDAPKQVPRPQRPKQRAVARNTVRNTVSLGTSPTTPTPSAAQESVLARLRRLERASGELRRWLPNKLSVRQPPLGRMLRVWLARAVRNVQKRRQLPNLRRVHGDQLFSCLETHGSPLVLHQPGV
jgi:hypothetical protein